MTYEEGEPPCTQSREVHYVDADGARQRMQSVDRWVASWRGAVRLRLRGRRVWDRIDEINATLETIPADSAAPPTTVTPTTTPATNCSDHAAPTTTTAATTTTA